MVVILTGMSCVGKDRVREELGRGRKWNKVVESGREWKMKNLHKKCIICIKNVYYT